jgi:hypothetical protein
MGEQLSLVGVEGSRQPADGLFFAVLPEEVAAADISRLAQHQSRAHGLKGEPILADRFIILAAMLAVRAASSLRDVKLALRWRCHRSTSRSTV